MSDEKKSRHKNTRTKKSAISPERYEHLQSLFFMGGISSYAASKEVGVSPKTAKIYFQDWAEKLTEDEDHIPWSIKEGYARARYKESITIRILKIKHRLEFFDSRLMSIITIKNKKTKEMIDNPKPNEEKLEQYERYVRNTELRLFDLQQEYATVDMMPPTEILLQQEIKKRIDEIENK